jgi:hypothetical protein
MIKNIKWLLLASISIVACSKDSEETPVVTEVPVVITSGTANFSKYVAVGNSLTAGYSDGALYKAGQENSWTKILSDQFKLAGGGDYKIPFMNDNYGGLLLGPSQVFENRLYFNGAGPERLSSVEFPPTTTLGTPLTGPFNNMGVPGAKVYHLLASGYGNIANLPNANPYFVRFASTPNAKIIDDATAQNPTFFTLWIGNNDILGYATNGGDGVNQTGNLNPATYGSSDITDPNVFAGSYNQLLIKLTANGAKGVVGNIPDVTTIPYFSAVKYNQFTQANLSAADPVTGVVSSQIPTLNASLYGPLKAALTAMGQGNRINLLSTTGNNPMIIKDETLVDLNTTSPSLAQVVAQGLIAQGVPAAQANAQGGALSAIFGQARQAKSTDFICLTAGGRLGKPTNLTIDGIQSPVPTLNALGVTFPMPDKYVLLPSEVAEINVANNAYNATIQALATQYNLGFVDTKAILTQVNTTGVTYGNYTLTSQFVFGGAFSMDGVHPSARGYALLANEFSKVINAKYGSNLPMVNLLNYPMNRPKVIN